MVLHYDTALPTLLRLCEDAPDFANVEKVCLVRDLRGRLRLVCKPTPNVSEPDWDGLVRDLTQALGGWFSAPLLRTNSPQPEEARVATELLKKAERWPPGWPDTVEDALGARQPLAARWWALPRILAKEAWLSSTSATNPPWPYVPNRTPLVVSFFSFKGGVGRTTSLSLVARHLAMQGKKVVVVDLDLEAPGLAPMFDMDPEVGVVDALLDHAATGRLDLDGLLQTVDARGANIQLIGAGRLGWAHLEKLARLDYMHGTGTAQSPVEVALRAMLGKLKAEVHPDVILLDARAGLHDLAGLALHGLSHVDVLVGRDNVQSLLGMDLVLAALARRRRPEDLRLVAVQTFVPSNGTQTAIAHYRSELHRLMSQHLYGEDVPAIEDPTMPHAAIPIDDLGATGAPASLNTANEALLNHSSYAKLAGKILEKAG